MARSPVLPSRSVVALCCYLMDLPGRRRRRRRSFRGVFLWALALTLVATPRRADSFLNCALFFNTARPAYHNGRTTQIIIATTHHGEDTGWKRKTSLQIIGLPAVHNTKDSDTASSTFPTSTEELNDSIAAAYHPDKNRDWFQSLVEALEILDRSEDALIQMDQSVAHPNHATYTFLLNTLAALPADEIRRSSTSSSRHTSVIVDHVESIFGRLQRVAQRYPETISPPTRVDYNAVLLAWSKSYNRREAASRCEQLLTELWSHYEATRTIMICSDEESTSKKLVQCDDDMNNLTIEDTEALALRNPYCPSQATYMSALMAIARSETGRYGAERTEALLEEMERRRRQDLLLSHLRPTTFCVNQVLIAWSRSRSPDAHKRCEAILQRLEQLSAGGRTELQPDTVSYNTVIAAMAQSGEQSVQQRAEQLLKRMQEPDQHSFNSILNCWARSRSPQAAHRADAILRHWEKRFANGNMSMQPDVLAYNTVLTAWARSKNADRAVKNAELLLARMEKAHRLGNTRAGPNTISYNILISALTNSNDPKAADRALEILEKMKQLEEHGRVNCGPDTVSYTSIINVVANQMEGRNQTEAAEQAVSLLEELEETYRASGDPARKPNIRTYTAVIHAIARSRTNPGRAEAIMARIEYMYTSGDRDIQPDCVCYDALINAVGWSDEKGRSSKCFEIYKRMMELYTSRKNVLAKPDIITCNAVLNACVFDRADTESERTTILNIVAHTLEAFQSSAPKFGWPDHLSYAHALQAIERHVQDPQKRANMAETTFWQCCQSGQVSVLVVTCLHRTLTPWKRFEELLGNALSSNENEKLFVNWKRLPKEWTRFAPHPKEKRNSRPSAKQFSNSRNARPSMLQ